MKHEWNQTDFIIEDCPIHGYKITQIPEKSNYEFKRNVYSNIEEPTIFPDERNIIHSISNNSFRNVNRKNYSNLDNYYNQNSKQENNNRDKFYNTNYDIGGEFESDKEFPDNYTFYLSGTSKLKPKVTINNMLTEYTNQNINNYIQPPKYSHILSQFKYRNKNINNNLPNAYNYNDNNRRQKTISNNFNNSNDYLMPKIRTYINISEPDDTSDDMYNSYNRKREYYLTPNYYKNDQETNLDTKHYHLIRNINNQYINRNDNFDERRIITENYEKPKRGVINAFNKNSKYFYKIENVPKVKRERPIEEIIPKRSYKNKENKIPDRIKNYYGNKYKTVNKIQDKNKLNKNRIKNTDNEENNNNESQIKVRITNLNNHRFYISNNKDNLQNRPRPIIINKNMIYKINKNIRDKHFYNKNIRNDKYINYSEINKLKQKSDYSWQIIKDKTNNNKIIINRKESNKRNKLVKPKLNLDNNINIGNDKKGKIEEINEKYYDSQVNCLGGKKIIIKKKYKNNGEKIIQEVIKKEFKSNLNDLFKTYVPSNNPEGNKIHLESEKYYPYQLNCEKLQKKEITNNIINNNYKDFEQKMKEEKNDFEENKYRNTTFGSKSDTLRFELEDKEEKEADEQQILINSEFEDEDIKDKKNNNINNKEEVNNLNINNEKEKNIINNSNNNLENNNIIKKENSQNNIENKEEIIEQVISNDNKN